MEISDLSEDQKKAAREAARGTLDAADVETLGAATETSNEMWTGSPQSPGYEADYGQTMKPAPEWPEAQEVTTTSEVSSMGNEFEETLKEITGEDLAAAPEPQQQQGQEQGSPSESNAFEQGLAEMLQEASPSEPAHDLPEPGGRDL